MKEDEDELREVLDASQVCGPASKEPPYVRMAFPLVALPAVLRRFVHEGADALGVPPECLATPALGTCAAAIGNTCRIRINATWTEPAVLWALTLMESGSLKTPAYNAAVEPLQAAQRLCEESQAANVQAYKQAQAEHEADATIWKSHGSSEPRPPEPTEPKPVELYTSDCTVEALAILFANNPRGLAFTRDELSGFFSSFGAYKGGRGGDEATYLEFYNAGTVKLNRASGKRIYVHAAALSIIGTCQPEVFATAIGATGRNANQIANGLAARFVIAAPENKPKRWRDPRPFNARKYHELIAALLSIPLARDADGRVEPAIIHLLPEATKRFKTFVNEHGAQTAAIQTPALRYHYAKLEAIAARLGLIFYLCDVASGAYVGPPGVQEKHILGGIAVARWFGREAVRVYDGYESSAEREKRELLEEIRDHGGTITPREMRRMRRRWCDPLAAEMALQALCRSGWGELGIEPGGPKGGRPVFRFKLFAEPRVAQNEPTPEFIDESSEAWEVSGETAPQTDV